MAIHACLAQLYNEHLLPGVITWVCGDPQIDRERAQVVPHAEGRVLEIGIGPGHNLPHYDPRRVEWVWGLDPSPALLSRARRRPSPVPVTLLEGTAEAIPLENRSVDTVVTTYTLCSVPGIERALAEIRRVLRPGGRVLFLEHGAAPDPWVRRLQDGLNPVWRPLAGGCNLNRPMDRLLIQAGFDLPHLEKGYGFGPRFVSFMYRGMARPR